MSREPEHDESWLYASAPGGGSIAEPTRLLREILERIPEPSKKTLLDLEGTLPPVITARFGRVLARCEPEAERVDIVAAIDCIDGPLRADVDRKLTALHDRLVEGGLLVATVPALDRRTGPYVLRILPAPETGSRPAFHEFELQYRLVRAGFQAARIWRIGRYGEASDRLLCRAVRRAQN